MKNRVQDFYPYLACAATVAAIVVQLRSQNRLWTCSCDRVLFWFGDAWSSETSQHFLDPYSLTHFVHGLGLCGLFALIARRASVAWRFWLATATECLWEAAENTEFIIRKYRETTAAMGYSGDTVLNSLGDILCCMGGFGFAYWLGLRRSLYVLAFIELALLVWVRDNLLLNVVMLVYPMEWIRNWQTGG